MSMQEPEDALHPKTEADGNIIGLPPGGFGAFSEEEGNSRARFAIAKTLPEHN